MRTPQRGSSFWSATQQIASVITSTSQYGTMATTRLSPTVYPRHAFAPSAKRVEPDERNPASSGVGGIFAQDHLPPCRPHK